MSIWLNSTWSLSLISSTLLITDSVLSYVSLIVVNTTPTELFTLIPYVLAGIYASKSLASATWKSVGFPAFAPISSSNSYSNFMSDLNKAGRLTAYSAVGELYRLFVVVLLT